jgi:tetratricopeptide (TPR) repeat protein
MGWTLPAQNLPVESRIDMMILQGENKKASDTCRLLLASDSLNPGIMYRMGIACQNLLYSDQSLHWYYEAARLSPGNRMYSFALAKAYYGEGKFRLAEPLLKELCALDSMNWSYAYYLSGIYMQSQKYDDAIKIYKRFQKADTSNYVYLDKLAFATLKKGDFENAINIYNKSLAINGKNLSAIKNLAFLYASAGNSDTAVVILTNGIRIDSTDMDLYIRRAQLNYAKYYTKRALDDYLVVLASGDSSELYIKRIGIGYSYNLQPREAIAYLLKAYRIDSTDYETCSYLGQCYFKVKDLKSSVYYYRKTIDILMPVNRQLGLTYVLYAESQKGNEEFKNAIASYLKGYAINPDPNLLMIIANMYDEKLKNKERAIYYYQRFLNTHKGSKTKFRPEYIEKIRKRLEFLKKPVAS